MSHFNVQNDEPWRNQINSMLNRAARSSGVPYHVFRSESYRLLEERGKCQLLTRLNNLRDRLKQAGATKTKINEANRMDVIESDDRLKEIYTAIVKQMCNAN